MGRIKSTLVKRTSKQLIEKSPESFSSDFEKNKKVLANLMPSKRLKNRIAGYIARIKKNTHNLINNSETKEITISPS